MITEQNKLNSSTNSSFNVCLFGAGKIGEAIVALLSISKRYNISLIDSNEVRGKFLEKEWPNVTFYKSDLSDVDELEDIIKNSDALISALPFFCNTKIATLAGQFNKHYFDLTEDIHITENSIKISNNSESIFAPQCGLAPGFISIVASNLIKQFDSGVNSVESLKLRVGALPIFPANRLKYNLTWSTEGLINEYINLCEELKNGKKVHTRALEGYEIICIDGVEYEAFNTSGGLGTLCSSLENKVKNLNYKSLRYTGHRELISFLIEDLGFKDHPAELKKIFETNIASTNQDKCIIFVEAKGDINNKYEQRTYVCTVYNREIKGVHYSAIQIATSAGICTVLDLVLTGKVNIKSGLLKNEEISLEDFLNSEFGKYYLSFEKSKIPQ